MKMTAGSLYRKKTGWWYLITTLAGGKQKWVALKTKDEDTAKERAAQHVGSESIANNTEAYLQALIDKGKWAEAELAKMRCERKADGVKWEGLFDAWKKAAVGLTKHDYTLECYAYTVQAMVNWAVSHGVPSPATLDAATAKVYASEREAEGVDFGREITLFSRVWRDLGFSAVWPVSMKSKRKVTRYRRLSVEEVRSLVAALRSGHANGRDKGKYQSGTVKALPDVADMVAISYHTGLRRGDCAGLTVGNVDGDCLRVVPEKTEGVKGNPLLIPLQPEAKAIVERLVAGSQDGYLFPRLYNASLAKCLRNAFERSNVTSNEFGNASFHSLRATFISMMDEAGASPHVTDAITGHAKQGMHGRYSQPSKEALMDAVTKAITPLFQK